MPTESVFTKFGGGSGGGILNSGFNNSTHSGINRPYMSQRNWVNAKGGYCALFWDGRLELRSDCLSPS